MKKHPFFASTFKPLALLAAVFAFHVLINFVWRMEDRLYFGVTHFYYFHAVDIFSGLMQGEFVFYPLLHFFTAAIAAGVGFSYMLFGVPGLLSLGIIMFGVYRIGELCVGKRAALLAACGVSFVPFVFGASRCYDYPAPVLACCAVYVCLLLEMRKNKSTWAFWVSPVVLWGGGIMGGGFSPSETVVFFVGVAGAGLWFVVDCLRVCIKPCFRKKTLRDLVFFLFGSVLGVWAVVASITWQTKWSLAMYFNYVGSQKNMFEARITDWTGDLKALLVYPVELFSSQLGLVFMVFFIFSLKGYFKKLNRFNVLFLYWLLVPFLVFSVVSKKSALYTNPVILPIVLITFYGLWQYRQRIKIISIFSFLLIAQFFVFSFADVPNLKKICFFPGHLMAEVNPINAFYAKAPVSMRSEFEGFVKQALAVISEKTQKSKKVHVVSVRSDTLMHVLSPVSTEIFLRANRQFADKIEFTPFGIPEDDGAGFVFAAVAQLMRCDVVLLDEPCEKLLFESDFGRMYLSPFFKSSVVAMVRNGQGIKMFERVLPIPSATHFYTYASNAVAGFFTPSVLDVSGMREAVDFLDFVTQTLMFNTGFKAACLYQAALLCAELEDSVRCRKFLQKLECIIPDAANWYLRCDYTLQIAEVSAKNRDFDKAAAFFNKALQMSKRIGSTKMRAQLERDVKNQQREFGL